MYTDVLSKDAAAFSTNTGHNSTSSNATWAANNPEAVIDFGWRAMHMTTVASKAITAQYYGKPADRNYYIGCSTGGRQGLKSIQRFPEDFDGMVSSREGSSNERGC
jgi:feruloyl esterase